MPTPGAPSAEAQPSERWLTKREIAVHYAFSTRWVERMQSAGMPSRAMGGRRRYRLSEVDAWLAPGHSGREGGQ